jgi:hypothetical protein
MKDKIIEEVWRNRDLLSAKYNHDLDAIVAAMQKRQRHPLTALVKKPKPKTGKGARRLPSDESAKA